MEEESSRGMAQCARVIDGFFHLRTCIGSKPWLHIHCSTVCLGLLAASLVRDNVSKA